MFKVEYENGDDAVQAMAEYLEKMRPDWAVRRVDSTQMHWAGASGLNYCFTFEDGVGSLFSWDVCPDTYVYSLENLKLYQNYGREEYEDVAHRDIVVADFTDFMGIFGDVRVVTRGSVEDGERWEPEGELGDVAEGELCWYGFGGDPYFKQILEGYVVPQLPQVVRVLPDWGPYLTTSSVAYGTGFCAVVLPQLMYTNRVPYFASEPVHITGSSRLRATLDTQRTLANFLESMERQWDDFKRLYVSLRRAGEE